MISRSFLFVPGDRPERFAKALATDAHRVVIDLEDAVALDAKERARELVGAYLESDLSAADRARLIVRVNAHGTAWHSEDLKRLKATSPETGTGIPGIAQIMVPKSEHGSILTEIATHCHPNTTLLALIETVAGVVHIRDVAQTRAVTRLAFGSVDYAVDAGIDVGTDAAAANKGAGRPFDYVRSQFVIESRYAGIEAPIDGVTLSIDDENLIAEDASDARRFGFGGKLCIHPKQINAVNRAFLPSDADVAWATRVMQAIAAQPAGAIAVDGKLVDKPVVDRAKRILAQ